MSSKPKSERITIELNGRAVRVPASSSVAAALYSLEQFTFRRSVAGEPRGALCGMGICFECRVTINGHPNCRSCQVLVGEGMVIETA